MNQLRVSQASRQRLAIQTKECRMKPRQWSPSSFSQACSLFRNGSRWLFAEASQTAAEVSGQSNQQQRHLQSMGGISTEIKKGTMEQRWLFAEHSQSISLFPRTRHQRHKDPGNRMQAFSVHEQQKQVKAANMVAWSS